MGLNSENAMRMCFDIETAPLPEAADYLVEPIEAPSNYKDPAKIAAYIEEKKAKRLDNCSLDPDLCRVVAVCTWREGVNGPVALHAGDVSEKEMLEWFWREAEQGHLVGFNCLTFDLPVLLRRSLYLDVLTPWIQIDKFKHPMVTDLQSVLSFNGATEWHSLSFYAKRFGFDIPDGMDGSGIAQAVAESRWDDIEQHVKADVVKTALVADRCGYFSVAPVVAF
jgi:predicted PolB exonuclease-like 3'-5' exonuclease